MVKKAYSGGPAVCLPDDDELRRQLLSRQYFFTKKNRLILETKDDYKRRTGFDSPDRADALVMTFYDNVATQAQFARRTG